MLTDIYVIGSGVALATGRHASELLLATMADLNLLVTDTDLQVIQPGWEEVQTPVLLGYPAGHELLLDEAYTALQEKINEGFPILLLLPDKKDPQYDFIRSTFSALLVNCQLLKAITLTDLPNDMSRLINDLKQNTFEQFTVFAVDSLVGSALFSAWPSNDPLRTQKHPNGRAAGEAWGWFTLSRVVPQQQPAIVWQGGHWCSNPIATDNEAYEYQGLALSIEPLIQQGILEKPDVWIYSRRQTPRDDLEAFMAFQYHWGNTGFHELEQLCPARQIGDLGVAAFPVVVALACERLNFSFYPKKSVLASDSQGNGTHFSFLLTGVEEN